MAKDLERRRAIDTAATMYLAEEPLDMSLLAQRLGVSRATLYRWVGNHDELLGTVLAEATERTYRKAMIQASGQGPEYIVDVFSRVMRSVEASTELRALTKREPMAFIKLAMMPGPIESISASITAEILQSQVDAGQLTITLSPQVLGEALVRICDIHLYAPLLGGENAEIETALDLITLLLAHST
ncbi:AcrR family transcriptional regulator [Rhodococcus erythropolis]|uniref:QsdR family transcriptional regulator n=1 Tax=Rhodococcus erythropolis TaxID=1833 RepID=UPI00216971B2|nr:QsdR family transcriptional regulator [Rhodococcus erythropolis]MCS4255687.1 AcrR family transcriptional regulator [Rhodococcus erythropolis]MCW2425200.1 AcrR family transcriptional regulator [Rhodococcus erythropolis]